MLEYITDHIQHDINAIKREYNVDVSPEVGRILYSFVSYNKNRNCLSFSKFVEFMNMISGLEKYIKERIKKPVSLHETIKSGWEICEILNRDKESLSELERYVLKLKNKKVERNKKLPVLVS